MHARVASIVRTHAPLNQLGKWLIANVDATVDRMLVSDARVIVVRTLRATGEITWTSV